MVTNKYYSGIPRRRKFFLAVTIVVLLTAGVLWGQDVRAAEPADVPEAVIPEVQETPRPDTQSAAPAEAVEGDKNYFSSTIGDTTVIYQTLKWRAAQHVRWYEILIEIYDDQVGWKPYEPSAVEEGGDAAVAPVASQEYLGDGVFRTTESQLTLSLYAKEDGTAQLYRYTITLYNLLQQPAFTTDAMEFYVQKAFPPKIHSSSKDLIYLDTNYDGNVTIRGENLRPDTQFSLVNGFRSIPLISAETSSNYERANLEFDEGRFDVGVWSIRAENPGEFVAEIPLAIRFQKPVDFTIALEYAPVITLYGNDIKEYFGEIFFPLSANLRMDLLFLKRGFGYFGMGLSGGYFLMNGGSDDFKLKSNVFTSYLNIVYHKPFLKNKLRLKVRLGAGAAVFTGFFFDFNTLESPPLTTWDFAATGGVSLAYYIISGLYIEAGVDWQQIFSQDMPAGFLVPSISVGYQF